MNILHYLLLLRRLFLLMVVYTFCRIFFFFSNQAEFASASFLQKVEAFANGLRFDLAAISWLNVPFIVLSVLPLGATLDKAWYQRMLRGLFLVSNFPFILLNIIDIEFFKFTGRRTSAEIFRIANDVSDQAPQLILHYWYIPLSAVVVAIVLNLVYPRYKSSNLLTVNLYAGIALLLVIALLTVLAIRSSLALKPLQAGHAFNITPTALGNVVLNTPFVFLKTLDNQSVERVSYFESNKAVSALIAKQDTLRRAVNRQNVVIIILESFGSEYLGVGNHYQGYTPFLDSLARQGLFFRNHYANGRRSIEAMSAIMASVPALMSDAYISSGFQTNHLYGLGNALQENGYSTAFFHGGRNGTMNFDVFAGLAGFQKYYGQSQYPDAKQDYDGNWGIFDEPFLQFTAQKLSEMPQPFGVGIFTLSSHQPYTIPPQHQGRFPKGTLAVHESIGYADYALRQFFKEAAKTKWYENTVFIITADHTQESEQPYFQNEAGNYDVPLIWFHPAKPLPAADSIRLTQHADIMPSVLDYLGLPTRERIAFGQSVFDHQSHEILNLSNGNYLYLTDKYYLLWYPDGRSQLFDYNNHKAIANLSDEQQAAVKTYEQRVKAYIQYYNNGLLDNNWYQFK